MRRQIREAIPSMFHRRLVLVTSCAVFVVLVLILATARLTIGPAHATALREAEDRLTASELLPTYRGDILDRRGKRLAHDKAGSDIAVHYSLIDGSWAYRESRKAAQQDVGRDAWNEMSNEERTRLAAKFQPPFDEQVAIMWSVLGDLGQLSPEEIERRRTGIASRVQYLKAHLMDRWREKLAKELGEDKASIPLSAVFRPIAEERQYHSVLDSVPDHVGATVRGFIAEAQAGGEAADSMRVWQLVRDQRPTLRNHPNESMTLLLDRSTLPPILAEDVQQEITVHGVGLHLLGRTRQITKEDLERLGRPYRKQNPQGQTVYDLAGYSSNFGDDTIGVAGIERTLETTLRGSRGRAITHLDEGARREVLTPPRQGNSVQLTIDIQLQARIQAIMSPEFGLMVTNKWHGSAAAKAERLGEPLAGAAVVMDIKSGEVLAAVSVPSIPTGEVEMDPRLLAKLPLINRAVETAHPPGSTIKPFMLVAASTANVHSIHDPIRCEGVFDRRRPTMHRCWIFRQYMSQHGPLDAAKSIEVSCNIYYYQLGKLMGLRRTVDWYGRFGLGKATGCGVLETGGDLPDPDDARRHYNAEINMGIGQGPVTWTPMQAAAAYATLVNDGVYRQPTLVMDEHRTTPRRSVDLKLNQEAVRAALDGLDAVVNGSDGTGRRLPAEASPEGSTLKPDIFNTPEHLKIYGKSGSAQTGREEWYDYNVNGVRDVGETIADPTHSWFVAMIEPDGASTPTHVVVVVTEFAGGGARVSGPIANQVIHALIDEGYLPK